MLFVATLAHPPEQRLARKEFPGTYKARVAELASSAKKLGVKVHGAYVSPNEHAFYFVLESDDMDAVSEFLGPSMLTHNSGHVSPVVEVVETSKLVAAFEKAGRWTRRTA